MTRKLIYILLCAVALLTITGCKKDEEPIEIPVESYSYFAEAGEYIEGEPGVQTENFRNKDTLPIPDAETAIKRARGECTVAYDTADVGYDGYPGIWRVTFYAKDTPENRQVVYMDSQGRTNLVVYQGYDS